MKYFITKIVFLQWILFTLFCNEIRDDLKKNNPDLSFGEMNKTLGQKWKELDDKQKWIEMAQEERMKYEEEIEEFKEEGYIV